MCDNNCVLPNQHCLDSKHSFPDLRHLTKTALFAGILGLVSLQAAVTVQKPSDVAGAGTNSWAYLRLEAESFETQADDNPDAGFSAVDKSGAVTSFLGNPILGANSTASGGGALFTKTIFSEHADKVTYKVQ